MRIRMIDVDGVTTRYLHAGEGDPLILIHGIGVAGDTFFKNVEVLGEKYSVYAPDIIGHGFTDSVDYRGGAPQARSARHLLRFAEQLGLAHYSVGGSSFGGLISSLMYFASPERIDTVIIIGAGSVFHPPQEQADILEAVFANASKALGNPTLETCRARLAHILHPNSVVPEEILLTQLTSYALPDRFDAYKAAIGGMRDALGSPEHQVHHRLNEIEVPCLVITGREDIRASLGCTRDGVERIPDAELHVFDECGHLPYLEHPERFNQIVSAFLDKHRGRPGRRPPDRRAF